MTPRQKQALDFVTAFIAERGFGPSYSEIQAAMGLKTRSRVAVLLDALVEQGRLRRTPNRARGIEVVGLHERTISMFSTTALREELARREASAAQPLEEPVDWRAKWQADHDRALAVALDRDEIIGRSATPPLPASPQGERGL